MDTNYRFNPIHVVRGLQGLLALLTLALLAHVAQFFNSNQVSRLDATITGSHVPHAVAFAIFTSVFTLLITLPYVLLTPRYFPHLFKSHTKYTVLFLESLNMLLWFVSFVSVAAFLGHLTVCRGDVCNAAKAGTAISAFAWVSWAITSLFALRFCLGMTGSTRDDLAKGQSRGEQIRERVLQRLRLHRVWPGQAERDQEKNAVPHVQGVDEWDLRAQARAHGNVVDHGGPNMF